MPDNRPNILHFCTDGQRFDTVHATGNPIMRTPSLDRLAHEGVAFTSAYTTCAWCVPARNSMNYGEYPYRNAPDVFMAGEDRLSFVGALANAGYRTHGIGKCDFYPDTQALRGFQTREVQEELLPSPDKDDYLTHLHANGYSAVTDPLGVRGEMYYIPQLSALPVEAHPAQWIGDRARGFIEREGAGHEPWYLYCSWVGPRPPTSVPSPWHKLYRAPLMPLPNVPPDVESLQLYINHIQNRYKFRDRGIDQNLLRTLKAYYYAYASFIDFQIGRVMESLAKAGQMDNTLVVFGSDHGEYLGDYNCFGLRTFFDACARIPLIVRWPNGTCAGRICDRPASIVDIAPTMLAAAGVEPSDMRLDGVDLADLAEGTAERETIYHYYVHDLGGLAAAVRNRVDNPRETADPVANAMYAVIGDRYKYAYSAADNKEFLFDRANDPLETRNLAGSPFSQDALVAMRRNLISELKSAGRTEGLEGDSWKVFPSLDNTSNPDAGLLIQDYRWADQHIPGYSDE